MSDFDREVGELEKELFSVKGKIEPIFNFIDSSFQLFSDPIDDNVATLFKKLNELRRYYDSKATLNVHHSENIIDIFRFCVRKVLSKALNSDFTEFDLEVEQNFDMAETETVDETSNIAPRPKFMNMETHSKIEWLRNKKLLVSDFEKAFDGLVGDGQSIVSEFVD